MVRRHCLIVDTREDECLSEDWVNSREHRLRLILARVMCRALERHIAGSALARGFNVEICGT